jgi:nicotinate-nucleotide pyrophosphorylase (carboxylating)
MWSQQTRQLIDAARDEDLGTGDITAALLPGGTQPVAARVVPRSAGVICGFALAPAVCDAFARRLWTNVEFTAAARGARCFRDGDPVDAGEAVGLLRGTQAAVLAVERTLLNFLVRLSGVASLTRRFVQAARAANPDVAILDTRKTLPGWRELDKYAVRAGGGTNHRAGLYDAILIKDNHLAGIPLERLATELRTWLQRAGEGSRSVAATVPVGDEPVRPRFVEVEVDSLAQFDRVCVVAGVDIFLLDNFSLDDLRAAVARRDERGLRGRVALEASGGVTLENVAAVAATGVERISVGALTHSAPGLDIGLDL